MVVRLLGVLALALWLSGVPPSDAAPSGAVPAGLVRVAEIGERIYDAIKARQWAAATAGLRAAERDARELPAELQPRRAELASRLAARSARRSRIAVVLRPCARQTSSRA